MQEISVTVLYFGQAREASGVSKEAVKLRAPASLADLVSEAESRHQRLAGLRTTMRLAVNSELADGGQKLNDGDEVAFLPAIAGG